MIDILFMLEYFFDVLYLIWTLDGQNKIKCSRGAGRYGGGTVRRGAAWTFNFFKGTVSGLYVDFQKKMFTRRGTVRRRNGTAGRRVNIWFF